MPLRSNIGTNGSGADGTSMTVTKPTDCKNGDKIWAILSSIHTGNPMSAPDGTWTQIESIEIFTPNAGTLQVWEKTAGPSEPSTYTFTQTDSTAWATMCVAAWGGTVIRYNNDSGTDVTGSTHATGTITTTNSSDLVLSFFAQDNTGSDGSWAASLPSGLTMLAQVWGSDNHGLAGFVERRKTAGTANHEATQTGGGAPSRGSTWAIFAIHTDGGNFRLLDKFNRGDTTDPSSGSWPWVQGIHSGFPASHDIVSNALKAPTGGFGSDYWDEMFAADQAAEYTVVAAPTNVEFRVCMRMVNPGVDATVTGYEFCIDPTWAYIVRVDASYTRTTLLTIDADFLTAHRVRCECRGNMLSMYQDNGSGFFHIGTAYDDTYVRGGYIGVMTANDTVVTIDDFWAGDMGGPIFPQLPVLDTFDRSNGDPGTEWSTAFVASASKPLIDTNVLKSGTGTTANSGMYWNGEEVQDGEAYITIPTLPAGTTEDFYLTFRAKDVARTGPPPNGSGWSGYQIHYVDTFVHLRKYDGSAAITLQSSPPLWFNAGDSLGVSFYGNKITMYYKPAADTKWSQIGQPVTDSTYLDAGYIGLEFDDGVGRADSFGGGKHAALTSYGEAVVALNPTSYWPLTNGSLNDYMPAALQLKTVDTAPTATASIIPIEAGAANGAQAFSGGGSLNLPTSASYNFQKPSPDWTIVWWQKITSSTFGSGFQRMFEKRDAGADVRGYLYYGQGSGDASFDVDPGAASAEGFGIPLDLVENEVYMMAVGFEASTGTILIFKNGVQIDDKSDFSFEADLFHHNGEPFAWGSTSGDPTFNEFIGVMDELAIWEGTLLTEGQLTTLFEAGSLEPVPMDLPVHNMTPLRWR